MVTRSRRVVWADSARRALDEVIGEIANDSPSGAMRVLVATLEAGESLEYFADRGRVLPEIGQPTLRELFVFKYRLVYRVYEDSIVIRAFIHGARDFARWRREEDPEL